jgi:hypothetical protein
MNTQREEFELDELGDASKETRGFLRVGMLDSPGFGAPPPNNHRAVLEDDDLSS